MSENKPLVFRFTTNSGGIKRNENRIKGRFCDVTIVVQEQKFLAHRNMLASFSEFFDNMLQPGTTEHETGMIHLNEEWIDAETFEEFLQFAYLGQVTINEGNCHALCKMAHFLMFDEMLTITEKYIADRIHVENFVQLAQFAHFHQLKLLSERIAEFLAGNFEVSTSLPQYLELNFDCLKFLLNGANKCGALQEDIFCGFIKWIEHDTTTRSVHLFELLSLVQMTHLSGEFLRAEVAQNELIRNSFECLQLVMETFSQRSIGSSVIPSSCKSFIYIIEGITGHSSSSSVSCYDPFLDKWTKIENFCKPCSPRFRAAFNLGSVFLFNDYSVERLHFTGSKRKQETVISPMNGRIVKSVAVLEDKIYIIGVDCINELFFSVLQQNPENQTFYFSSPTMMNSTMENNRMVGLGGHLYSLGTSSNPQMSTNTCTVERYCPRSDQWVEMPNMKYSHRINFRVEALEGKLYVYSFQGFEMFDPVTLTWTKLPLPHKMKSFSPYKELKACCGKLYLIEVLSRTIHEFDPNTRRWKMRAEMPTSGTQTGQCAVVVVSF